MHNDDWPYYPQSTSTDLDREIIFPEDSGMHGPPPLTVALIQKSSEESKWLYYYTKAVRQTVPPTPPQLSPEQPTFTIKQKVLYVPVQVMVTPELPLLLWPKLRVRKKHTPTHLAAVMTLHLSFSMKRRRRQQHLVTRRMTAYSATS